MVAATSFLTHPVHPSSRPVITVTRIAYLCSAWPSGPPGDLPLRPLINTFYRYEFLISAPSNRPRPADRRRIDEGSTKDRLGIRPDSESIIDRGSERTTEIEFSYLSLTIIVTVRPYVTRTTLHSLRGLVPRRILIPLPGVSPLPRRVFCERFAPSSLILLDRNPDCAEIPLDYYSRRSRILASLIVHGHRATLANRRTLRSNIPRVVHSPRKGMMNACGCHHLLKHWLVSLRKRVAETLCAKYVSATLFNVNWRSCEAMKAFSRISMKTLLPGNRSPKNSRGSTSADRAATNCPRARLRV